jgi:Domain of unknown function (DUF4440)
MGNEILCACIAIVLSCGAFGRRLAIVDIFPQIATSKIAPAQPKLAELLESRVRNAWATFKKRDKDGYAEFLSDDFQAAEADGDGERSKDRVLREVEHSMYTDYLLQLFQVQRLGPDHAFVTYEATIQFPTGSAVRYKRLFIGELWTEHNRDWKMMRYQETPVR